MRIPFGVYKGLPVKQAARLYLFYWMVNRVAALFTKLYDRNGVWQVSIPTPCTRGKGPRVTVTRNTNK